MVVQAGQAVVHQMVISQAVRQLLDKVTQAVVIQVILIQAVVVVVQALLVKTRRQIQQRQQVVSVFPLIHHGDLPQQQDKMFRAQFITAAAAQVESMLALAEQELLPALTAAAEFQVVTPLCHQD
jgi:hypothetical protein